MSATWDDERIRQFWEERARQYGRHHQASWSEHEVIEMEIREIVRRLDDGDRVLDTGCANGYSTVRFATQRRIDVKGVDYVAGMIEHALARADSDGPALLGAVRFAVGDVLHLDEPDECYDKVVAIRLLINLGGWDQQLNGARECLRVLRVGGLFLLSDATRQGWERLNDFRLEWGLPPIPMPGFNAYLDEDRFIDALAGRAELIESFNFGSTYFVATRVIKPLLARILDIDIDVTDPNAHWNRWFASLPAWGNYGAQKLFVFRKTS